MSKSERKRFMIGETKEKVFERDGWHCQICGEPVDISTAQMAHLIPQTKGNIQRYGEDVIHDADNLLTTCSLQCNAAAQVSNKYQQNIIALDIYERIERETMIRFEG